jgi:transcriptional regulator with XRE-family HTH domain
MDNRIAVIRKQKGMTQAKLANAAGISRPYLSTIESGQQQTISSTVMFKIARVLEKPIGEIFFDPSVVCAIQNDMKSS